MAQGAFPVCPHIVTVQQGGYLTIPKGSVPYFPWISDSVDFTILDISDYDPPRVPSKTWRELIKKVWEVDPLTCPQCGSEMRIISLIQDPGVIRQILDYLGLWRQDTGSRCKKPKPGYGSVAHEDFDDGWPGYEEPTITFH